MNHTELKEAFGSRLVTLNNGQTGLRGGILPKIRAHEGGEPIIDFIASDETLDRYDEIVTADGWDLVNYSKNPVFINSHQYGDISFVLGKSIFHEARDGRLHQRIRFAVDSNPVARLAFNLYRDGFLHAVSVGFAPLEWVNGAQGEGFRRKFLKQELLELSAVCVPANPNALQMALQKGCISRNELGEASDLLASYAGLVDDEAAERTLVDDLKEMRRLLMVY